jgi:hypothetical protein
MLADCCVLGDVGVSGVSLLHHLQQLIYRSPIPARTNCRQLRVEISVRKLCPCDSVWKTKINLSSTDNEFVWQETVMVESSDPFLVCLISQEHYMENIGRRPHLNERIVSHRFRHLFRRPQNHRYSESETLQDLRCDLI